MTSYTITNNDYFKSIEISFTEKPSDDVRNILKALRFRWHYTKKVWYGYANKQVLIDRLNTVLPVKVEAVKVDPVKADPVKVDPVKADPVKVEKPVMEKKTEKAVKVEKPVKKAAAKTEKAAVIYQKQSGLNKLKKAVMGEKQPCIMVVDKKDNSIIAKLAAGADVSKYDRFQYCFYTVY